jgi:HEAT repeat protein
MKFQSLHIDLFSFWFGFILATLFWLIVQQLRKLAPKIKQSREENRIHQQRLKDLDKEHDVRGFALRKAQSSHMASSMFPLDKVLIEPKVILPIKFIPENNEDIDFFSMYKVLPDIPEIPELYTDFPAIRVPLHTLIEGKQQYIAISANPGYGKTTALAALTSHLCSFQSKEDFFDFCPVFIDYLDLVFEEGSAKTAVLNYLIQNVKGIDIKELDRLLTNADKNERLVFLIDNLDLLPLEELNKAHQNISILQKEFPHSFIVITCDPFVQGNLFALGFEVFSLSTWNKSDITVFLSKWKNCFADFSKNTYYIQKIEHVYRWLLQENHLIQSPIDLTLKAWLSFSGNSSGNQIFDLANDYIKMISGGNLSISEINEIIKRSNSDPFPLIPEIDLNQIIDQFNSEKVDIEVDQSANSKDNYQVNKSKGLFLLQKSNFLKKMTNGNYQFLYPTIFTVIYSIISEQIPIPVFSDTISSPTRRVQFQNKRISKDNILQVDSWLANRDAPLYRDLLVVEKWLKQTNKADPLREKIFRSTAKLLQDHSLSTGLRLRFILDLIQTNDPTIPSLFSYFANQSDPSLRRISAFAFGTINDPKGVPILVKLSKDADNEVQKLSCLSLNRIWNQSAQSALVDIIFNADEELRCLVCQIISMHQPEGYQILQELAETDNYLARKAAVSGLVLVDEPWVPILLEKMSIQDTQWVVRDAAKFAVEHPLPKSIFIGKKHITAHEDPRILNLSDEMKIELPSKGLPTDLLYQVLENKDLADQGIALEYLLMQPDAKLIKKLVNYSVDSNSALRETATNALYQLSKAGILVQ